MEPNEETINEPFSKLRIGQEGTKHHATPFAKLIAEKTVTQPSNVNGHNMSLYNKGIHIVREVWKSRVIVIYNS